MAKVLIVDDKESNLFALENVLKRLDIETVKASTGNDALRATLSHDFALAILDVQMPVMDGYELANLLRSDSRTRNIPIIFLSAVYSEDYHVFRGYESGAVDFITKPFTPEILLSKVRVFLDLAEQKEALESLVSRLEEQVDARRRTEEEVLIKNRLLRGINSMLREGNTCETEECLAKSCLSVAEELTGSQFGFIGEIGEKGLFCSLAISGPGLKECGMPRSDSERLIKDMEIRGVWGKVLEEGKPLIINDLSSHPDGAAMPEGHPRVATFMGVPMKKADLTTGMIALANKLTGYDQDDLATLESIAVAFSEALLRKRAEDSVKRANDELEDRVRERTSELTQYMERLEILNRELQDFAFIASHDLQEPLRKIQAFGDRLRHKCEEKLDDTEKDYLLRMEGAANRMQDLIRDLLKYSRVATRPDQYMEIDLNQVMEEVVQIFDYRLKHAGGTIDIAQLPAIEADPTQMKQLFQNLIGNALKFQKEGEAPRVRVYSEIPVENLCRIHVEDNGIGFDELYANRIFAPFQRLHGRNAYDGTGMGLAICRKIVERHGGDITVKSKPGSGTSFVVSLPVIQR